MSGISERNPFVGPRPIQQGEPLYGRTAEVRELYNRLQARRIVVLHSPSGAGKSSLVHAGLIPKLKEANFDVWKPIRVNLDPRGLKDMPAHANRYQVSAMVSLEEELPAERRRSPAELAGMDLLEYLDSRPRRKNRAERSVVLLFDQFEEVLTVKPQAIDEKREFMAAIGRALNTDKYWALFIIREDYLAAFAPYRDRIPTQMANTFRLDLLGLDGARETAVQLASQGGRTFPGVDKLIHDLSTIQIQQPDGSYLAEQGQYVEPVQLQVVGRRLWDAMPEDDLSIDDEDITEYAGVSTALAGYYADSVAKIAHGDLTVERAVREWVGSKLIVGGIRSQIRQETGRSGGLDNALIDQLRGCYLVRTEQRAGANWFELSHDRLVEPVQRDNQKWENDHLHPLQVQAKLWEGGRRDQALLLRGSALNQAASWSVANAALLTEGEREFLDLSGKQRGREFWSRFSLWALLVSFGVTAVAMGFAWRGAQSAREQAEIAETEAKQLREQAEVAKGNAEQAEAEAHAASLMAGASELLARNQAGAAARVVARMKQPELVHGWAQLVADILTRDAAKTVFSHKRFVWSAAWSPDGTHVVTASGDQTARVWRADDHGDPIILAGHEGEVVQARWSPDGKRVVTASKDGTARVWNADGSGEAIVLVGHLDKLTHAEWSPDGARIITTSDDRTARIWNADGSSVTSLVGHGGPVKFAAWSPDGTHVVTSSGDATARVWNADGSGTPIVLAGHTEQLASAQWSHDGKRILTGSWDDTARVWNADGSGTPIVLRGHQGMVLAVVWSPDDTHVATASADGSARIWRADGSEDPTALQGHENWVVSIAWSSDGRHVVTASKDQTARVWNVDGSGNPMVLAGHKKDLVSVEWSADSQRVVTASSDRTARIWEIESTDKPRILEGHQGWVYWVAWSPDGKHILTAAGGGRLDKNGKRDNTARIWNADGTSTSSKFEGHTGWVYCATWSPDGEQVATASGDQTARIWNVDGSGTPIVLTGHAGQVRSVTWSPDGERVITAAEDWTARIWNSDGSGTPIELKGHTDDVRFAAWSPDGTRIVTVSEDKTARVWNADGSGTPRILEGHEDWVMGAAWSPDSKRIVTASTDMTARIWNADGSGQPVLLIGHEDGVLSAAWSPDGARIVTASEDKTARVWRADGVGESIRLTDHDDKVMSAGWSPDGHYIVTASVDRTARIWQLERYLDLLDLRADLFNMTTECLSWEQRRDYLYEDEAAARAGYEVCEREYERTPYFDTLQAAKPWPTGAAPPHSRGGASEPVAPEPKLGPVAPHGPAEPQPVEPAPESGGVPAGFESDGGGPEGGSEPVPDPEAAPESGAAPEPEPEPVPDPESDPEFEPVPG